MTLEREGYHVVTAEDGERGFGWRWRSARLIVTDVRCPGDASSSCARRGRAEGETPSSSPPDSDRQRVVHDHAGRRRLTSRSARPGRAARERPRLWTEARAAESLYKGGLVLTEAVGWVSSLILVRDHRQAGSTSSSGMRVRARASRSGSSSGTVAARSASPSTVGSSPNWVFVVTNASCSVNGLPASSSCCTTGGRRARRGPGERGGARSAMMSA